MEDSRFDRFARVVAGSHTRRGALALLGAATSLALLGVDDADAKKKKKKKGGKKKGGKKSSTCKPVCTGCGGSNGCGGTCGCSANQFCDAGTCRTCDVTCTEDAVACGARLNQRMQSGGTIYVCPGLYQGNFNMIAGKLMGAGSGDNPANNTILDGGNAGRVVSVADNANVELIGLRIIKGNAVDNTGGGVRSNGGELRISRCVIDDNSAPNGGGGVFVNGPFQITNTTISNNESGFIGGGLRVDSNPGVNGFITDSMIIGNNAASYGGAIYKFGSPITVTNSQINGNSAGTGGGALVMSGGSVVFNSSCKINNNTAGSGGLAHATGGTISLNGATHVGNSTPECVGVTC